MENEKLRAIIVSRILSYAARFQVTNYKALCDVSSLSFKFMDGWAEKRGESVCTDYTDYKERFFDFVLGDYSALTDTELYYIGWNYSNTPEAEPPAADVLEELKEAVTKQHTEIKRITDSTAEIKRITDSTAEIRRILRKAKIDLVFERINDFVRYNELVHSDGKTLFYMELYMLGLIDGKRQERTRRRKAAHT